MFTLNNVPEKDVQLVHYILCIHFRIFHTFYQTKPILFFEFYNFCISKTYFYFARKNFFVKDVLFHVNLFEYLTVFIGLENILEIEQKSCLFYILEKHVEKERNIFDQYLMLLGGYINRGRLGYGG